MPLEAADAVSARVGAALALGLLSSDHSGSPGETCNIGAGLLSGEPQSGESQCSESQCIGLPVLPQRRLYGDLLGDIPNCQHAWNDRGGDASSKEAGDAGATSDEFAEISSKGIQLPGGDMLEVSLTA
mmetsp:Transcript_121070/g.222671  ORF Transcript_121070/g.222671 Transcript_121070/m.222671 type:complete len:128 (-) Transcript_121070:143-526(-)